MKATHYFTIPAVVLLGLASAQYPLPLDGSPPSTVPRPGWERNRNKPAETGTTRRASKVIGMDVHNASNDKLGSVADLGVSLADGRVVAVIISSGGFLGVGDELSIIPPQAFRNDDASLKIDLTKDQLAAAPRFQASKWPDLNDRSYMTQVYETYKVDPFFNKQGETNNGLSVWKASDVMKMEVKNPQGDNVGGIEDLIIAEDMSRISSVVVSFGGFLGVGNEWSVIPPQELKPSDDGKSMVVTSDKQALNKAPRFKSDQWPDQMNAAPYVTRIYEPFNADYMPERTAGRPPSQQGTKPATASDQSNDGNDIEMTRVIRRAIVAEDNLSFTAKNIKVITSGGQVTLAGQVKSTNEAQMLQDIASKHAGTDHVSNQIQVRND